ncbi:TPA: hypothetical protein ACH3X1_012522 [Trebouxia sp. C0004]
MLYCNSQVQHTSQHVMQGYVLVPTSMTLKAGKIAARSAHHFLAAVGVIVTNSVQSHCHPDMLNEFMATVSGLPRQSLSLSLFSRLPLSTGAGLHCHYPAGTVTLYGCCRIGRFETFASDLITCVFVGLTVLNILPQTTIGVALMTQCMA